MVKQSLEQFQSHPQRFWIVLGVAVAVAIVIGLPVYDRQQEAAERIAKAEHEIAETKRMITNVEPLRDRLMTISTSFANSASTIDEKQALKLRENVVRAVRARNSRMLRIELGEVHERPWRPGDDPLQTNVPKESENSKFELHSTKLNVSIEGTLPNLAKVLHDMVNLHEMAVPTQMKLSRIGNRDELQLEVELTLLHISRKST